MSFLAWFAGSPILIVENLFLGGLGCGWVLFAFQFIRLRYYLSTHLPSWLRYCPVRGPKLESWMLPLSLSFSVAVCLHAVQNHPTFASGNAMQNKNQQ